MPHRAPRLAFSIVLFVGSGVAGCATGAGGGEGTRDSGPDPSFDAGPSPRDAGAEIDGGLGSDGGPGSDGGSVVAADAAVGEDGGASGVDSGPADLCTGVDCSSLTAGCLVGVCDPETGRCTTRAATDGTGCDDGDRCTMGDACRGGACSPGAPLDCSGLTTACATGVCSPTSGTCTTTPVPDGTSCGTGPVCASSGSCQGGTCVTTPTADCASCGPSLYCAGGSCGPNPTMLSYGFESGALPAGWTNGIGGTTGWTVEGTGARSGTYRARSGAIGHSAQSRMGFTITLATSTTLSFWLMTSTESCCDHLELYVDGARQGQWQGTTPWTFASFPLAAGTRTIEFRYVKDGSVVAGSDAVWIDDLTIGGVDSPSTGFEGGALPAGYATSGSAGWSVVTSSVHGGTYAAASGTISDSETSSMTRVVAVPSATTLTFWYRVSSESGYDFLRVYVDGVQQGQWSGEVPWAMASVPLAAGTRTIEWRYSKDGSIASGSDRAWVDDIDFGFTPPPPTGLCGP